MRARAIVRRTVFNRQRARKLLMSNLVILLILTMAVPAWAVVFTNPASITINDAPALGVANPYPSNINVAGLTGTITNITVTFDNFNHTFPDDLDVLLVGPTGSNLVIWSDAGGSFDLSNGVITFDDAAPAPIINDGPMGSGTYDVSQNVAGDVYPAPAPAASANTTLAGAFGGTDPNGTWSLYIVDDTGVDQGVIGNGWYLTITTTGNSATAFTNGGTPIFINDRFARATPYPSTINVSGLTGAITDVNVTLTNINHLNPDDIDILLVAPTGKGIVLMSDSGGTGDVVNQTVTFDDAAAGTIPDAGPLVSGTFDPANFGSGDNFQDVLPFYPNAGTAGPATLATSFNGTDPNGTWTLYVIDDATNSTGSIAGGWSLDITAGGAFNARRYTVSDFDGDGKTDVAQFRPSDRNWYIRESADYSNRVQIDWGNPALGDELVPGDYDGDRKTDIAVWRASEGNWYIINSSTGLPSITNWGQSGDVPVPADYDGDGRSDIAVWRANEGNWYIRQSSNGFAFIDNWGQTGDIPVPGHYGGSAVAIRAIYRPSENNWYLHTSPGFTINWGAPGDILVPGDYDANGATDFAVWRPSEGRWYVKDSTSGAVTIRVWGLATDIPVPGDYDGDARTDFAVFRASEGNWFILNSGTTPNAQRFDYQGQSGDVPIPSAYVQQ